MKNPFKKQHKQLSIFTTAGYPEIDSLRHQIETFEKFEIDFIEVGIPFSDPIADGPTIQKTSSIAIENGMNLTVLFEQLKEIKTKKPLVLMGYLNPVMNFGIERFLKNCFDCGITSVILPDLSLEIYQRDYQSLFEKYNVYPVFIITPKTEANRVKLIARTCRNSFVYLVSDNATTGTKSTSFSAKAKSFQNMKSLCEETPLMVGFGIQSKVDVLQVQESADGAIIGSAYLKALENGHETEFLMSLRE